MDTTGADAGYSICPTCKNMFKDLSGAGRCPVCEGAKERRKILLQNQPRGFTQVKMQARHMGRAGRKG